MKRFLQISAVAVVLIATGCVSLSLKERQQLGRLAEHGYDISSPPAGFEAPLNVWTVAGLNALPGVGNFYLASNGGGGLQWVLGTVNLLLWPISPCWAVAEGGLDALTLNKRALLEFCRERAQRGEKLPAGTTARTPAGRKEIHATGKGHAAGAVNVRPRAPYEITTEEAFSMGRAVFRVSIVDSGLTAFDVVRMVKPEIETILRDALAAKMPGLPQDAIRTYVVPEFAENRVIRFRGWAFAMKPIADGWRYDPETRRGVARFRLSGGMPTEEAKRWARETLRRLWWRRTWL